MGLRLSLQQVLYRILAAANQDAREILEVEPDRPGRFPVTVRPETRAFLDAHAQRWGGSVASVAGAILDGVAMSELRGGESSMQGTAERLSLLLDEHDLSYPAAAEAFEEIGLTLSDLSSTEALRGKLTSLRLRAIAEMFHVRYDWLAGKSEAMIDGEVHRWYKSVYGAAADLWDAKCRGGTVKLIVVTSANANLEIKDEEGVSYRDAPHFMPVIYRARTLPGGETLGTYEVWEEGRWSYWRSRHHLKMVVYFATLARIDVIGKQLSEAEYGALRNGSVLPASVLDRLHSFWHVDDYVPHHGSAPSLDKGEWLSIAAGDDFKWAEKQFKELVAKTASTI
ncbi:hypothetical protein [Burkholderia sp. Ax-1719]|uniref:hypothetical protein n=1 Tax=Burkholderia sp. Ax-1719 TaxID=2608334 RepID=UPI00141E3745|nr:hypothetical protein [Burkholderia sp. Ax-1719]NIE63146.1 hypothetical protein [Burkholderia sp. Ax-1719]